MDMWAIILNIWPDEPVYHAAGDWKQTRCGRKVATHKPYLPHKHVVKFARPCRGCFPK